MDIMSEFDLESRPTIPQDALRRLYIMFKRHLEGCYDTFALFHYQWHRCYPVAPSTTTLMWKLACGSLH